jgi:NTP pyrophosphatase (non-canonical NTP hydrolase)
MKDIAQLVSSIRAFRDARDWSQFHNSKDLALALSVEASELLELFLWKGNEDADPDRLKEELADIMMYALLLVDKHGLDIFEIIESKIKKNNEKYPVEKAKGNAKKYNEL